MQLSDIVATRSASGETGYYLYGLVSLNNVNYGTATIENVEMSNYYSDYTFYFYDCDYSEINLTNITLSRNRMSFYHCFVIFYSIFY